MAKQDSLEALNRLAELEIPYSQIEAFCRRWQVSELALFGSVVREDFNSNSDVDILVSFVQDAPWSLFDLVAMKSELEAIFGRNVDLVEKDALRNPYRRKSIFDEMKTIYATG
jgi:predicted nucleotidyltransferase